jgi:predicted acetylornithine/succinylornithine family transaminase
MTANEQWSERGSRVFLTNYKPRPVAMVGGEGSHLIDADGNRYVDFVSGIAVSSLGYGHPKLTAAVQEQAGKLLHTSNVFWNEPAVTLSEKLVEHSFGERVFLSNSGAEANEAMLKLARRVFHERGEGRYEFVCFESSFHGRTMATVTCTGQEKYKIGFEPLLPGVRHVPFGDLGAVEAALTERTAAIFLEPIQGEGGLKVPPPGFLRGVRDLCDKHGCLMLLDEVQSGVGRTGKMWAYEHEDVIPDAMSVAKGIGGGLPVGAMITTEELGQHMPYGSHGSTYGGNPVACAAANVVMDEVTKPEFLKHVSDMGEHLLGRLQGMAQQFKGVAVEARGRGLWCGLELGVDGSKLANRALAAGLVLNVIGGKVVRVAPPLVIDRETLDDGLNRLEALLGEL